jgi:Tfp pilus assembly protein PilO
MADLSTTRQRLKVTFIALGAINVVMVALWFSPLLSSAKSRLAQLDQLRSQMQQKTRQVEPLKGLDKKVIAAGQQIDGFYSSRLPGRYSAIAENLDKLAGQSGVQLAQVKYSARDPEPIALRPVEIEASLAGDYLQLVRFINSLERDELFFIVDSVDLAGEEGQQVRLQLKLRTFLKTGV